MGNEFIEEDQMEEEKLKEDSDEYIKFGVISKKGEERGFEDNFLAFSDLTSSKESKNKIHFGLFGVLDGHNSDYVANYLSNNCKNIFEQEAGNINKDNHKIKIEEIFKTIDKNLKDESGKIDDKKNNINIDEKEIKLYKDLIEDTKEFPDDLKNIEDSQIKDLLLFKNLFKYNNNYLYNNTDIDYIGSSASIVLINRDNIITADLGITTCILFNKEGKIVNNKEINDLLISNHIFSNKKEKKRIKQFNENIDYENLKKNIYIPTTRCFGLFKYKSDPILNEENQIISCIPEVNIYNKDNIDYILLMTKGMVNLLKNNLIELIEIIITKFKGNDDNINICELLNEYINKKIKEIKEKVEKEKVEKEKIEKDKKIEEKQNKDKAEHNTPKEENNLIYVGKEDFSDENEQINELKNNYYKEISHLKKKDSQFHDKYNITCMLIKLSNKKYPIIEIINETPGNDQEIQNKEEDTKKDEELKKEDLKSIKEIKNINNDKEKEKEKKEENNKNEINSKEEQIKKENEENKNEEQKSSDKDKTINEKKNEAAENKNNVNEENKINEYKKDG